MIPSLRNGFSAAALVALLSTFVTPAHTLSKRAYDPKAQGCTLKFTTGQHVAKTFSFNLLFEDEGADFIVSALANIPDISKMDPSVVQGGLSPTRFNGAFIHSEPYQMTVYSGTLPERYNFEFGFREPYGIYYVDLQGYYVDEIETEVEGYSMSCKLGDKTHKIAKKSDFVP
ncbi:hypothetical protein E5Q_04798 [Mixia osmundae IAM 14324]|uniref:GOLD domain-containing protein n=1 Tax=Mixia osmundae (strain CBS 9802 / IAM 14324 / JCM 22182 / KY 12970) TaxID=764103 RepID=G7E5K5_MIXOS|nr:hypothetical protein E5Q_04798 [Mixia osmundae IAM 14324]